MSSSKRARSCNFTPEQKGYLADLMKDYPNIELKSFDSNTLHKKSAAWQKLFQAFMQRFPADSHKFSLSQLQTLWKRMKQCAKMEFDKERKEA